MKLATGMRLLSNILAKNQEAEHSRYLICEYFTKVFYPRYKFSEFGRIFLEDRAFLDYYETFEGRKAYRSLDRKYTLDQLLKLTDHLPGDTAECGAYLGASSYLICRHLVGKGKRHHVFDSFEGISEPSTEDGSYWKAGDLKAAEAAIRKNLAEFDFVDYYKGWIPERFREVADRKFSFVHVDVDLYQPTLDSLAFFYERLVPGGLIVGDDYGFTSCPGARQAFDTFFAERLEQVVSLPTGQALVQKA